MTDLVQRWGGDVQATILCGDLPCGRSRFGVRFAELVAIGAQLDESTNRRTMLLNYVLYEDGKKIRDLALEGQSRHKPKTPSGFVWAAFKDATQEELEAIRQHFDLHELAIEDIQHGEQRPKIEEFGDALFFSMHLTTLVDGELEMGEMYVFVGSDYVVSVRSQSEQSLLGVRARAETEPHLLRQGPVYVAYALLDTVCDGYFPVLEAFEEELERIEEQMFQKGQGRQTMEELYALKRRVGRLRHAVRPLMEAVSKLHGGRVPRLVAPLEHYFRDVYDHLYRIQSAVDAIRDTIATAIQVNLSMVTIEDSEVNKRLAAWAAIIAVVPAMAAVWGMNFRFMPELGWEWGYPFAIGMMFTGCTTLYVRFKRANWL